MIARVKASVTRVQVAGDLDRVSRRMRASCPDAHGSVTGVLVKPLHEEISGRAAPMAALAQARKSSRW